MLGRRGETAAAAPWQGDDYLAVYNFFERWHVDTQMYFPDPVT
jgi:hypothetical protein